MCSPSPSESTVEKDTGGVKQGRMTGKRGRGKDERQKSNAQPKVSQSTVFCRPIIAEQSTGRYPLIDGVEERERDEEDVDYTLLNLSSLDSSHRCFYESGKEE